jgi:hypothetical protein
MYLYHAKDINFGAPDGLLFGTMGTTENYTSSDLWVSDKGILYLVMDHKTGIDYYIGPNSDMEYTVSGPEGWDFDDDGVTEYRWKLDFTELPKIAAGESFKEVTVNCYLRNSDAAPDVKSDYNSTDVSTTWVYSDIAAYVNLEEGAGTKITKIELDLSGGSHNHTYVDNNTIQIQYLKITDDEMSYRFDTFDFDYGAKRVQFDLSGHGVKDDSDEIYGIPIYREMGEGSRFCTVYLRVKARFHKSDLGDGWCPNIKITTINPAGTLKTVQQLAEFS